MLTRRTFTAGSLASAGTLFALSSSAAISGTCGQGADAVWGDLPSGFWVPRSSFKILEIYLYGGLSPWETFYHRPSADGSGWRGFLEDLTNPATAPKWSADGLCRYHPHARGGQTLDPLATAPFDLSDPGHPIHFGPATAPLWTPAIMDRMRCFVTAHDLLPHEAAIPFAATGLRLGRPNLAGLGAAIQHRRHALDSRVELGQPRKSPACYVCTPAVANFPNDNLQAFTAIGQHPGSARPVTLKIGGNNDFVALLERKGMTGPADDILREYRQAYLTAMTPSSSVKLRWKGYDEYHSSTEFLLNAGSLRAVLNDNLFKDINDPSCVVVPAAGSDPAQSSLNVPRMSLAVAASLLSHATEPADYACVIDGGLISSPFGGGYDTHGDNIMTTFRNLYNTLASLRELIDLKMIDLDTTLIVINTEFGRTPNRNGDGRDHWPNGYVVSFIGGPIAKRGMIGRIHDANSNAVEREYLTVTDLRAAALLAAGICPFEPELFGIGDLSRRVADVASHDRTMLNIKREVFGVAA